MTGDGSPPVFRFDGETFAAPEDWPRLLPPAPDEPAAAHVDRAIAGHPFVQAPVARGAAIGLKPPTLDGVCPAECTVEWWRKKFPDEEFSRWNGDTLRVALTRYSRSAFWRLAVEWFDLLRAGDLVMTGRRLDRPDYGPEPE